MPLRFDFSKKNRQSGTKAGSRLLPAIVLLCFLLLPAPVFLVLLGFRAGFSLPLCLIAAAAAFLLPAAGVLFLSSRLKKPDAPVKSPSVPPAAPPPGAAEPPEEVPARERELLAANSELASFNYTISHEIKAPVRAIDGYARIFLEDYGGGLDPEARDLVENIRHICAETIALSNKLLEYTSIAREEPCNEIVDLQSMIAEVFHTLQAAYSEGGVIRLEFTSSLPPVIGDPVLLRQAVVNLLSNALKFTREKPEGLITAGWERQGGEDVYYIRDNGAGFDMQFSEKLFGMFQRMHTADEFEGSGIGLSIVKKIIQLHHGRVWITGEVGRGATVYFTFPPENVLR